MINAASSSADPIDAVVLWVDGSDPEFRRRREDAVAAMKRDDPERARVSETRFAPIRYVDHGEIRYCLRSIVNHAPWVRTIWLVTDDQFPACLDRSLLGERVVPVDHRTIFRDVPDGLPVFSSDAIEMMVSRIPGLSERFVLFNDDFFLTRPTCPTDFFIGDRPVLRGRWTRLDDSAPSWLGRRIRSAALFGYDASNFFKEVHVPYALHRGVLARIEHEHPGLFEAEARYRFRSSSALALVALHNHACIRDDLAAFDTEGRWIVLEGYPQNASREEVVARLMQMRSGKFLSTCINSLGDLAEKMPEVYDDLGAATGPPAAFER